VCRCPDVMASLEMQTIGSLSCLCSGIHPTPFLDLSLCGFITVIAFQKSGLRAALRVSLLFSEGMIIQAPWIFVQCSMFEHTLPEGYIIRTSIIRIGY